MLEAYLVMPGMPSWGAQGYQPLLLSSSLLACGANGSNNVIMHIESGHGRDLSSVRTNILWGWGPV